MEKTCSNCGWARGLEDCDSPDIELCDHFEYWKPIPPKRCRLCGKGKRLSAFNRDAKNPDGHRNECRACQRKAGEAYQVRKRKEAIRAALKPLAWTDDQVDGLGRAMAALHPDAKPGFEQSPTYDQLRAAQKAEELRIEKERPEMMVCSGSDKCKDSSCILKRPHVKNEACTVPCGFGNGCIPEHTFHADRAGLTIPGQLDEMMGAMGMRNVGTRTEVVPDARWPDVPYPGRIEVVPVRMVWDKRSRVRTAAMRFFDSILGEKTSGFKIVED